MRLFNLVRGSCHSAGDFKVTSIVRLENADYADSESGTVIVSSFSVHRSEKVGIIQCFQDANHIYAFGQDPERSQFSLTYTSFLGKKCMTGDFIEGSGLKDLSRRYDDLRASVRGKTVEFSIGGGVSCKAVVESLVIDSQDPELNSFTATISGRIVGVS